LVPGWSPIAERQETGHAAARPVDTHFNWRLRFLVASRPVRDLFLGAKHLFFAGKAAIVLAEAQGRASVFGEQI
jgi:hypothetical protein